MNRRLAQLFAGSTICLAALTSFTAGKYISDKFSQYDYIIARQQEIISDLTKQVSSLTVELKSLKYKNYVIATVTAYSPSIRECDSTPYTTAFLKRVQPKYVAISRDLLRQGWSPGRKVYIEGIGVKIIGDLMSPKVKGPHVDVFMWRKEDALKFGKSKRYVFLMQDSL